MQTQNEGTSQARVQPIVRHRYVVKLEDGCWLADGEGDPPRTTVKDNAKRFSAPRKAVMALQEARKYRPFRRAEVYREDREPQFDQ